MKNGNVHNMLKPMIAVAAVFFFLLEARLVYLQAFKGKELRRLSDENRLRIEKVPAPRGIIFDRNGIPLVKNSAFYSVALLPEMLKETDIGAVSEFLGVGADEIMERVEKGKPFEPIKIKEGLGFNEVARIEARLSDFPSLSIYTEHSRRYLYGEMAAHLIGFLGKLSPDQANRPEFQDVPLQSFVGQWGVEKLYDSYLRGTPGNRALEVDALGRYLKVIYEEIPIRGKDLYLSIDLNTQKKAEEAFGDRAGALVAFKPDTGEVLAMISRPSFDPNLFSRGIKQDVWAGLQNDPRFPLYNRTLQSQFPPGSTFKILTGIAALEEGAIGTETTATCTGGINSGKWRFGCWQKKGHGTLAFRRAVIQSCDVYFYKAGEKTGIDAIAKYARMLGLGKKTGIPLVAEKDGNIPDTAWKLKNRGDSWYLGETYNAAIGQGYVLTTPAQMARIISTVTNGGYLYKPSLLRLDRPPRPIEQVLIRDETLAAIKDALRGVVTEGTGGAARSKVVDIGGKTGTAQVVSKKFENDARFKDHAWFVAFAPVEKPAIALSVFVEHGGHGGSAAAPIAKIAIEAYMEGIGAN